MNETRTRMKYIHAILLALLLAAGARAQEKSTPVIPCCDSIAFTIRIPVRTAGMRAEHVWYRDGVEIQGTRTGLTAGVTAIFYTIPPELARGENVVFHFKYRLDDGCNEWTSSPKYVLTFAKFAPITPHIAGDATVCPSSTALTYSVAYETGVRYDWTVPATGWRITSGQGTNSITVALSASAVNGDVSVLPFNNCKDGVSDTLSVSIVATAAGVAHIGDTPCVGAGVAGVARIEDTPCVGAGVAGVARIDPYPCSGGARAGVASIAPY